MANLTKESLQQKLADSVEAPAAIEKLQASAVLVLVVDGETGLDLILTRRAYHLSNHPGQISFAGGTREKQDNNLRKRSILGVLAFTSLIQDLNF